MYKLLFILLICLIYPLQAQADILWNQTPNIDTNISAIIDQEFPDDISYSAYQVHDVVVGAGGWNIQSITTYYTFGFAAPSWPGTAQVLLNIFKKSGSLPGPSNNPAAGIQYTAMISNTIWNDGTTNDNTTITLVTLSGLNINLAAGDYWIGITPKLNYYANNKESDHIQEFHLQAKEVRGDYSAVRNPLGAFGDGSDWGNYDLFGFPIGLYNVLNSNTSYILGDGAILIEGTSAVPEPATMILLGSGLIGVLGLKRKFRK